MKKSKGFITLLSIVLILSFTLVGCGSNRQNNQSSASSGTGEKKVEMIGSTSVTPLAQDLADSYEKTSGVKIDIQGVGSTPGIQAAIKGTAGVGMSSRNLEGDEKSAGLTEYKIAIDGIAVIVNPANARVKNLTVDQINKIFTGQVKNWKEVGGDDEPILLVSREAGSGTRTAFEELAKLQKDAGNGKKFSLVDAAAPIIANGNGAVKSNVATKKGAIGYISLGMVDNTVKKLSVNGVEATSATASKGTYKFSRPFLLLTKGAANGEAKKFIDYILSKDGQTLVEKSGYIKVSK